MERWRRITFILIVTMLFTGTAIAADTTLTEQEAQTLREYNFAEVVKKEKCIVMYYNPDVVENDGESKNLYAMTPLQVGERLMRGLNSMREKTGSTVKLYKVNWKDFPAASIEKIRFDLETVYKQPENPSFAVYTRDGRIIYRAEGIARPDVLPWLINEMMNEYIPSVRTDKGEYLRAGWMTTDTNVKYIGLVNMRSEGRSINGKIEHVRINSFKSLSYRDSSCEYELLYLSNGKLIGSIETCKPYGQVGYYDYDGTGKMQYRVKYRGTPANSMASTQTAPSAP